MPSSILSLVGVRNHQINSLGFYNLVYIHSSCWLYCFIFKIRTSLLDFPLNFSSSSHALLHGESPKSFLHFSPSRAVEHPSVPESPEFVRVRSYESQMVIRPHKSFDEVSSTSSKRWLLSRNAFYLNWAVHGLLECSGSQAWHTSESPGVY